MSAVPTMRSELSMNLKALRLVDPGLSVMRDHATHVVVYSFKPDTNEWEKVNIEGALFVYSRQVEPTFCMTVINRLHTENLVEQLNEDLSLQIQEPFLLYKNGTGKIYGLWFYNHKECGQIAKTVEGIVKGLTKDKTKNGVDNMMSMLSVSENSKVHKDIKVPDGTSKRVLDFFAMAKNTTPCQPPGVNQRPPGVSPQRIEPVKPQADVKPLLQRLLSNPNQPVKTVEQIEKQHMSTPKKESAPIDIVKVSPRERNQPRPRSLVLSEPGSIEKKLENGLGFVRIPESSSQSVSPPGVQPLDRPCSSSDLAETPSKVPLFTPNMFMSSQMDPEPLDSTASCQDIDLEIKPEPLTKAQLLQAVSYLLKNDPDFVNKLHEAYVKSFVDRVT